MGGDDAPSLPAARRARRPRPRRRLRPQRLLGHHGPRRPEPAPRPRRPAARPPGPPGPPAALPGQPRHPLRPDARVGPPSLYNWAEYVNPAVLKSFEKRYGVEVQLSTFSTLDEAVAKLAAGAVGYDVFVPTQPEISLLVAGKLIQPLNLDYVPNLRKNVWKMLQSPWYDVGSQYTVPYTVFSTGIGWRNDFLPDYDPSKLANPYESFWQMGDISGRVGMLDDQREGLAFGLLRNGITDVNTASQAHIDGSREAIQELIDIVNLRFYTNEYQHLADGSIWLHQAWGGDMTAIGYYLPKGTPVTSISYWWPPDGRGLMGNDTLAVLKGAPHPVLAHLFINHVLDVETAFLNMEFTGYQQPLVEMTPKAVVEEELVPENLLSAIVREEQFSKGFLQGPLSRRGDGDLGNGLVGSEGDVSGAGRP